MTTRTRAGTTTFTGQPTEDFFDSKSTFFPTAREKRVWASMFGGDCFDNAQDKDAWMTETMSGKYDCHFISTSPPAANAGSM